jgi:ferredoxin
LTAASITALELATLAVGAVVFVLLLLAALVSLFESEFRAARRTLLLSVLVPLPYVLVGLFDFSLQAPLTVLLLAVTGAAVVLLLIPLGRRTISENETPTTRIDERDIMFSRDLLEVGTPRFEEYYAAHPEKRAADDAFRALPGLLAPGSKMYNAYTFSAAAATFSAVASLNPIVEGEPCAGEVIADPRQATRFIKSWIRKLGAVSVGVTELKDYHPYSTIGRGPRYGEPVEREHDYAIAFTVEMDREMVGRAPKGPIVMESAHQYLAAGAIAVQVAQFIRNLGHAARAHIDANYRVVCPLVARDAGLGEIGRMGLLMTRELGPRVRIGVVTTSLPLLVDERRRDYTMIDFCTHCRKCAEVCPGQAISFDDRREIDGVKRWRIDSEACFTMWCKLGTDCGRCVAVCPYSHPDNLLHNLIRRGVRNSPLFRRAAIWLDDFFYGRKPPPAELTDWMDVEPLADTARLDVSQADT